VNVLPSAPVIPLMIGGEPQAIGPIELAGLPDLHQAEDRAWAVLHQVLDPEVPALSVCDLGIAREVRYDAGRGELSVWLTPTYSGCPATEAIEAAVREALHAAGFQRVKTELRRAPAWTTDWITAEGRAKLKAYGIAPPAHLNAAPDGSVPIRIVRRSPQESVACPRCESGDTERLSAFGTTACKSLWRCRACREPFEHFKPI